MVAAEGLLGEMYEKEDPRLACHTLTIWGYKRTGFNKMSFKCFRLLGSNSDTCLLHSRGMQLTNVNLRQLVIPGNGVAHCSTSSALPSCKLF